MVARYICTSIGIHFEHAEGRSYYMQTSVISKPESGREGCLPLL